jgi:CheY-like chemotaxis protein
MLAIDGLASLGQIRATPRWQAVRVLLLTTSAKPRDWATCLLGGADAFVQQSTQLGDFIQARRGPPCRLRGAATIRPTS